ncbi:hypothetical protein [Umezawaea tangerina]|uniref:Phage integrase family protein n=1 Tax=Umezawaea tangerina TaxID=84725 RepID=A0A2T0SPP2_9PSEU|nr:hypothetical protein [Umezawaea tangerina]PRY35378.1 hypothetical protein CLV43_114296 [Umezawaea tangerina]
MPKPHIRRTPSENTERVYRSQWATFTNWCTDHDRTSLPTTATTLADYVAHLRDQGRAPATIQQAVAAIRAQHRGAGFTGAPDTEAALLVLRDYNLATSTHRPQMEAPPITVDVLHRMTAACDKTALAGKRDRLLLTLGLALAGRRRELADLTFSDVRRDPDGGLTVLIRLPKYRFAASELVRVPRSEDADTSPVDLLNDWLTALAERDVDTAGEGPLLRSVTQHDRLYSHDNISTTAINAIVRRCAKAAALPDWHLYSTRSMHAGF